MCCIRRRSRPRYGNREAERVGHQAVFGIPWRAAAQGRGRGAVRGGATHRRVIRARPARGLMGSTSEGGMPHVPLARLLRITDPARGVALQAEAFTDRPESPCTTGRRDLEWRWLWHRVVRRRLAG